MPDIDAIAAKHGFPADAARTLLDALGRGGGRAAQFSHPALGGMGQWDSGGMVMIGDMFNDALKARVSALARDLAPLAAEHRREEGGSAAGSSPGGSAGGSTGWPAELGHASSSGSQNGARYAVFPDTRRLAIEADGRVTVFDTGDHRIGGASQQQGGSRDLSFASQNGTVRLSDLKEVPAPSSKGRGQAPAPSGGDGGGGPHPRPAPEAARHAPPAGPATQPTHASSGQHRDDVALLERLMDLHRKGVLTDEEYRSKKAEVLARL